MSRARCLIVAVALTAAPWGLVAVLVTALAPDAGAGVPGAVVRLCLGALVVAAAWAWLQAMAGVADAWRGAAPRRPGAVRRLALVACGAAVAGGLALPAQAADDGVHRDGLSGLPLPERAQGGAGEQRVVRGERVVVRAGDTLWALADADLGGRADDRAVTARWRAIYQANRAVVGPDPDRIHPGQVLRLGHTTRQEENR